MRLDVLPVEVVAEVGLAVGADGEPWLPCVLPDQVVLQRPQHRRQRRRQVRRVPRGRRLALGQAAAGGAGSAANCVQEGSFVGFPEGKVNIVHECSALTISIFG
jgi:hypothetical protein